MATYILNQWNRGQIRINGQTRAGWIYPYRVNGIIRYRKRLTLPISEITRRREEQQKIHEQIRENQRKIDKLEEIGSNMHHGSDEFYKMGKEREELYELNKLLMAQGDKLQN